MPVINHIRDSAVLKDFPGRTEADLYGWLLLHRATLEKGVKALGYVPTEDLIEKLKRERSTNPFARLMGLFRHDLDLHSLSLKTERIKFLEETGLDKIRPGHKISFTEAGCYTLTKKHIDVHKYLMETHSGCEIPYNEAVGSWYDNVYLPLVKLVVEHGLLSKFPKHTTADLYLWLISYREDLEKEYQAFGQIPDETIITALQEETAGPITRLVQFFQQKLHLTDILIT